MTPLNIRGANLQQLAAALQALPGANQQDMGGIDAVIGYNDALSSLEGAQAQQSQASQYIPHSGNAGLLAGVLGMLTGKFREKEARESLADYTRKRFEFENQAADQEFERGLKRDREAIQAKVDAAMAAGFSEGQAKAIAQGVASPKDFREDKPKPTTAERNFAAARDDPAFASFLDKQSPKGTQVTVQAPGANYPKPFEGALAKADVATYTAQRDKAMAAEEAMNSITALDDLLGLQNTGKQEEFLARAGQYFGTEAGASFQATQALVNDRVFELINSLKGPATDKDAERAQAQIPNMGTDPRARAVVFDYLRKKAGAQVQVFNEMDSYVQEHGGLRGFKPSVPGFRVDASALGPKSGGGGGQGSAPAAVDSDPSTWTPGKVVTVRGKRYRVTAVDPNDPEGADLEPI